MKTLSSTLSAVLLLAAGGGAMEPAAKTAEQSAVLMSSSAGAVLASVDCIDSERHHLFYASYYQECCDRGAWGVKGLGGEITHICHT